MRLRILSTKYRLLLELQPQSPAAPKLGSAKADLTSMEVNTTLIESSDKPKKLNTITFC